MWIDLIIFLNRLAHEELEGVLKIGVNLHQVGPYDNTNELMATYVSGGADFKAAIKNLFIDYNVNDDINTIISTSHSSQKLAVTVSHYYV